MEVNELSPEFKELHEDWELVSALMGGTKAMREAGKTLLPQWPNEDDGSYAARLQTAVLYPAYQHTVETLVGKVFSHPITIGEDVPARLKQWSEDIDLEGRNLSIFASDLLECAIGPGLGGILVEYPQALKNADGTPKVMTLADEKALALRPYFVFIKPLQILGRRAKRINGKWVITQLRFLESVEEPDGPFGTVCIQQVRVLEPGSWQVWRQKAAGAQWEMVDFGLTSLPYVPFQPIYGKRIGFMLGKPPLLELAHLNTKHWQSQSDQDTLLHVARVPILVRTGMQDKIGPDGTVIKSELTIGAASAVDIPQGATLEYCEHTGQAIGAGKQSLDDLKEEMRQSGAEMLVLKQGNTTRIEAAGDAGKSMCSLQRVALGLQDALNTAMQMMADYVREPTGGHVQVFTDFGALTLDAAVADIVTLESSSVISKETTFKEAQRRGTISADLDWTEEQDRIASQGPALGMLGLDPVTGLPLDPLTGLPVPPTPSPEPKANNGSGQ